MKKRIFALISMIFVILMITSCKKETNTLTINYINNQVNITVNEKEIKSSYENGITITIKLNPNLGYMLDSFIINDEEQQIENLKYTFKLEKNTIIFINMKTDEGYLLNITGNQKFEYEVTEKNEYGKYFNGTNINLTIINPKNYELKEVLINNKPVEFKENKIEFIITENTTLAANFTSTIINIDEDALNSIQCNVKISGTYVIEYPDSDEIYHNKLTTIFTKDKVHQEEYSIEENKLTYNVTFFNNDGYACISNINVKNEVVNTKSNDLFDDFDNPFKDLTIKDFEYNTEDGYYYLVNNLDEVASTITGWNETISSFKVKVENEIITKIEIETTLIMNDYNEYYMAKYILDVSMHNDVTIEDITPYEHLIEHDSLQKALDKVGFNYTVNHLDVEPGYDDIEYKSYILENIVYCGYEENGKTNGYLESDGYVYDFVYDGTTATIGSPLNFSSFKDIQSNFKGFVAEIFDYQGNGKYVIKDESLAADVAYLIGYNYDVKRLGEYATNLEIIIKDEILYQIKYDYLVWGVNGTVTLTYSDFNTTICPIKLDNIEQVTIFDLYTGIYLSEDEEHTVVIAENLIKIDNIEMKIEGFDSSQNMFYGTYNNVDAYVMQYFGKSELWIEYGDTYFIVSNENLYQETKAPTEYYGTFKNNEHTIIVSENGITFDDKKLDLLYYEYMTGVVCLLDNVKYYFFVDIDENDNIICYLVRPDLSINYILDYVEETDK